MLPLRVWRANMSTRWIISRAMLRRPTSVASVATNGGSRTAVISHACSAPIASATSSVASVAQASVPPERVDVSGPSSLPIEVMTQQTEANTVAENAITDPEDRSMPPAMMTAPAPSAKMPRIDALRITSWALPAALAEV